MLGSCQETEITDDHMDDCNVKDTVSVRLTKWQKSKNVIVLFFCSTEIQVSRPKSAGGWSGEVL